MSLPAGTLPLFPSSRLIRRGGLALVVLILTCSISAQAPPSPPSTRAPATLQSTTTLVFVPARVETPSKELVYTLTASDFELTDNGVPQNFSCEANQAVDPRPLALVVLIQTGGAAQGQLKKFAHFDTMLLRNRPRAARQSRHRRV